MNRALLAACCALLAVVTSTQAREPALPAREEPRHKVVLENDHVRVLDVQIPAGEATLFHTHDIASVIVYLTTSTNESQTLGETKWTPRTIGPGDSRYAAYDVKPLTHRVRNPGPGLFHVYDIELRHAPRTADAFALPDSPALRERWQENAARSLTLRLAAGGHRTFAPSACAHLLIGIAGTLTVATPNAAPRALRATEFSFQPARTGFLLSNGASEPLEAVVLELR